MVLAPEKRIDTDLHNAPVVNCLSVEIAFIDRVRNVAHDEQLLSLFPLIDCVVEHQIQDGLGHIGRIIRCENRRSVLMQNILICQLNKPQLLVSALLQLVHELGTHKIHILKHLKRELLAFLFHILMETHIPRHLVHKLNQLDQVLQPVSILDVAFVNEDKRFPQFRLQNNQVGLDRPVNRLLLIRSHLLVRVLTKQLHILEQILFLRLLHYIVNDINVVVNCPPLILVEVRHLHLAEHLNSNGNVHQQERQLLEVFVFLGLGHDLVHVVQVLFTLVTSCQLVECVDNVADLCLSLFH